MKDPSDSFREYQGFLKEKLGRYCSYCAKARATYDAALILLCPSIGDCIKAEQVSHNEFMNTWNKFRNGQQKLWVEYQEVKLACEDGICRNGNRNRRKHKN